MKIGEKKLYGRARPEYFGPEHLTLEMGEARAFPHPGLDTWMSLCCLTFLQIISLTELHPWLKHRPRQGT